MTTDEVRALLAAAEAATPGPWYLHECDDGGVCIQPGIDGRWHAADDPDAAHIAAANPAVVATLCKRVIELQEALAAWADAERNLGHIRTDEEWEAANAAEVAAWTRLHELEEQGRPDPRAGDGA